MSEIKISKSDLKVFEDTKIMGTGEEAICYFFPASDDTVIKIYHSNKRPLKVNYTEQKSSYIAFPKDIYKDKETEEILAITMPFLPGEKLEQGFSRDINIIKLQEAYSILHQELDKYCDIYMVDMCLDNILYDELTNRFYLIDTGRWHNLPDVSSLNQARIDLNLANALTKTLTWLKDYPNLQAENPRLYSFYINSRDGRYSPFLEYLQQVQSFVFEKFGVNAETLGDLEAKSVKKS